MDRCLQFSDKSVPYSVFVKDVAAEVVRLLKKDATEPDFISQRKAFELFGRANVERWSRQSKFLTAQLYKVMAYDKMRNEDMEKPNPMYLDDNNED